MFFRRGRKPRLFLSTIKRSGRLVSPFVPATFDYRQARVFRKGRVGCRAFAAIKSRSSRRRNSGHVGATSAQTNFSLFRLLRWAQIHVVQPMLPSKTYF